MPTEPDPKNSEEDLWGSFEAAFGDNAAEGAETDASGVKQQDVAGSGDPDPATDVSGLLQQLESMLPGPAGTPGDLPTMSPPATDAAEPHFALPAVSVGSPGIGGLPDRHQQLTQPTFLTLEQKGSTALKLKHKGVVTFRLTMTQANVRYELTVTSDLFEQPVIFSDRCPTPHVYDVGSIRFVPEIAGEEEIRVVLTTCDSNEVPTARLTGSWVVKIESPDSNAIQAGGDVIVVGGRPGGLPFQIPDSGQSWTPVSLLPDAAFASRIDRLLPPVDGERPPDLAVRTAFQSIGTLYVGGADDHVTCCAVSVGGSASIGRGGAADVCWWIRPVPSRDGDFSRISRKHITLDLCRRHAWITDHGANGTSLNGHRLPRGVPTVLGDDDIFDLAGVLKFSVKLSSNGQSVTAIELRRHDDYRDLMTLLLVKPGCPHALVRAESAFWAAWSESESVQLKLPTGVWNNAINGEEAELTPDLVVAWHVFDDAN